MAELYEQVDISNDVSIQRGPGGVRINGYHSTVYIADTELPALIARLTDAAGEMGVEVPNEWRDIAKRMLSVMGIMAENGEGPADYPATMTEIEQALAKAEAK